MEVEKPKTMNAGNNIEKTENEPAPVQRLVMSRFSKQSGPVCDRTGNTRVRPVIESGLLEELIDQFCDLLRRVLMAVVANAL